MSDRSGCSLTELTVLEVLDAVTAGRPRAQVRSAKALSGIEERIADRAAMHSWPDSDSDLARRAALPIVHVDDQSSGAEVRIVLTLCPGADPAAVRDQLVMIKGVSAEIPCAFPVPLASLLRSWVGDHRSEDIAASTTEFENALRGDQRARRNR